MQVIKPMTADKEVCSMVFNRYNGSVLLLTIHGFQFDVLHCGDVEKLIKKRQSLTDPILYYAYAEEIYSIIMRAHLNTGHGGRDKMLKEVNKKSPYKAMFGCDAKIGLSSSSLPQEILGSLQTEEDLIQHFQSSDKPDEISNDRPNELSSDKPNQLDEESQLNAALNLSETQETELDVHVCAVCENLCFSNIQCSTCAQYIHELCSKGNISDTITCHLCSNEEVIRNERRHASDSMTKQAVRMRNLSERVLTEVDVGANVLVAIPHVDRGKGDPRNLMAVVTGKEEHGYKLGIKDGILRGLYTRNQFELSDSNFIAIHCVNYDNEISFRKAVSKVSLCDGQGYTKCGCSASVVFGIADGIVVIPLTAQSIVVPKQLHTEEHQKTVLSKSTVHTIKKKIGTLSS
ncbi:unnamed protein product [Mytilus edulis]|uniref:Uncharacterized protein n=1 Tax=Mytilus edulis TaxID=6550 RepID=A0A8S3VJM8_MYTED|nr:unnamed protein product [Mytilus edulis]